jgi:hypothetical protein
MQLADFERIEEGDFPRFVTRVADAGGAEEFELRVAGPAKLVERMFGDADLDLRIDSAQDESWVKQEFDSAHKEHRRSMWELAALDDVDQLLKSSPKPPQRESSVLASARPVSGDGTPFFFRFSGFFVPTRPSLIFSGSWVLSTFASLRPATGNQDLFLHLFSPTGPVLSSSRLGGTAVDMVFLSFPLFPYVPVFRVFGSTAESAPSSTPLAPEVASAPTIGA